MPDLLDVGVIVDFLCFVKQFYYIHQPAPGRFLRPPRKLLNVAEASGSDLRNDRNLPGWWLVKTPNHGIDFEYF
ncbi:MAG: hypothetical protein WKF97_17710 [Chitinophagaceae bacterium]